MSSSLIRAAMAGARRMPPARSHPRLLLALAAVAAVLVYANSLGHDFVWDDRALILEHDLIRLQSNLGEAFQRDFFHRAEDDLAYGYYRPLTTLSYLFDRTVWGVRPFGFHLTNVALHATATVLVGALLLALGWPAGPSALAALFFAVHPIHTENVAWIAGRTDLLAFVLCAVALRLRLRLPGTETASATRFALLALSVAAFAAALLAKEIAVTFIAWALLVERYGRRRPWAGAAVAMTPYALVLGLYLFLRLAVAGVRMPGVPQEHHPMAVVLSSAPTIVRYLTWLVAPIELNAYVQNPYVTSIADPRFAAAAVILLAIVVWWYRFGRAIPAAHLMLAMLFAALLPALNLVRVTGPADMGNMMAERFAYFPSFPAAALAALAVSAGWARLPPGTVGRRLLAATVIVVLALASLRTVARNRDWRDERTFLTRTLEQSPGALLLWGNLANYLLDHGELDEAARAIGRAAALNPHDHHVLSVRARWHLAKGDLTAAVADQEQLAAQTQLGRAPVVNNLAYLYRLAGEPERAREMLLSLVEAGEGFSDVYFNLGELAREQGDPVTAGAYYERALRDSPDDLRIAQALASWAEAHGQPDRAEAVYAAMLAYYPDDARILNNLASIRHRTGDTAGALALLRRAVERAPDQPRPRINYADLLIQTGDPDEAAAQLRLAESAATRPGDAEVQTRLAALARRVAHHPARAVGTHRPTPAAVVLVTVDTLRADFVSAYGRRPGVTPYLDRLAARGVLFETAHATSSLTAPSMASLFTARLPSSHGVTNASVTPGGAVTQPVLAAALTTLAESFRDAGFTTIGVPANTHLGAEFGFAQGFDFYSDARFWPAKSVNELVRAELRRAFGARWVRQWKSGKTFLWIHYFDPHDPYMPRTPWFDTRAHSSEDTALATRPMRDLKQRYPRPTTADMDLLTTLYASEVSYFDTHFRRLGKSLGFTDDNVLLVVTADHGEEFAEHGGLGHGHQLFEEVLHVPLLVHWPAAFAAPRRIDVGVSLLDLYPTLLELAGISVPPGLQGTSLAPLLWGDSDGGGRRLISELHAPRPDVKALREGDWKLIRRKRRSERLQLFNLSDDPEERHDVAHRHPDIVARLSAALHAATSQLPPPPGEPAREVPEGVVEQLRALGYVP